MVAAPFELKHSGFFWLSPGIGCCELSVCLFTGRVGRIDIWIATIRGLFFLGKTTKGEMEKKEGGWAKEREEKLNFEPFFSCFQNFVYLLCPACTSSQIHTGDVGKKMFKTASHANGETDRQTSSVYVRVCVGIVTLIPRFTYSEQHVYVP